MNRISGPISRDMNGIYQVGEDSFTYHMALYIANVLTRCDNNERSEIKYVDNST